MPVRGGSCRLGHGRTGLLMPLHPFRPKVTAVLVDTPGAYDYSPSCVDGRLFWCCGLGTDTIVSVNLHAPTGQRPAPYVLDGKLVADPAAVRTGTGFLVMHTIGQPDGTRNGIGWFTTDATGAWDGRRGMTIPQSTNLRTYGNGQPSIAPLPGDRYLLVHRRDGDEGVSMLSARLISSVSLTPVSDELFLLPEDGASPEVVGFDGGFLILLVAADQQGKGWAGLRRYDLATVNSRLVRRRSAEVEHPVTGGVFWALPGAVPLSGSVDGAGIVRNATNDPVIHDGRFLFWRGVRGSLTRSADWHLTRSTIPVPA